MSSFIETLKQNLGKAKSYFITSIKDDVNLYSECDYYHASAYCLICHAEIEYYIGSIVRYKVQTSMDKLKSGNGHHISGIHAVCWYIFNCATDDQHTSLKK